MLAAAAAGSSISELSAGPFVFSKRSPQNNSPVGGQDANRSPGMSRQRKDRGLKPVLSQVVPIRQVKVGREPLGHAEPREERDQRSDQEVRPLPVDEHVTAFGHAGVIPVHRDPGPETRAQVGRVPDMVEIPVRENDELE